MELDDLLVRPGCYLNPQTEIMVLVDDSSSIDGEIFNMEEFEGADWVLISEEVPVDESRRDELLEAKSARREARGQAPLDIDAEVAALSTPRVQADSGLRDEVRQLVVARNERRERQGKPPLDVDAEVERQLRDLGG